MDDEKILELYFQRNEDAIKETACKYGAYCRSISYNILRVHEDAEECVSDTYQRAWAAIPPERPGKFKTWLGVVARNIALNLYNKNHAEKRYAEFSVLLSELGDCLAKPCDVEHDFELKELGRQINLWLSRQTAENRKIFLRRYWFGESVSEIAAAKGLSANALAQKLFRLRASLKNFLTDWEA